MARQDRVMEETKDKKNAVEAYVYEMSNKVCLPSITLSPKPLFNVDFASSFATSIMTLRLNQR